MKTNTVDLGTTVDMVNYLERKNTEGATLNEVVTDLKSKIQVPALYQPGFFRTGAPTDPTSEQPANGNGHAKIFSVKEISGLVGRHQTVVYSWLKEGLRSRKRDNRRMVTVQDLNTFLSRQSLPLITPDQYSSN